MNLLKLFLHTLRINVKYKRKNLITCIFLPENLKNKFSLIAALFIDF
jgi:hypothetical protein